jgi:hypothetical protein
MVQRELGTRIISLLFIVMAAVLMIFIVTQGLSLYSGSREYTVKESSPSINCIGHAYTVRNIVFERGQLSFDFRYESYSDAENVSSVTVLANESRTAKALFMKGQQRRLSFSGVQVSRNFSLYPDSCAAYAIVCDMESQVCR